MGSYRQIKESDFKAWYQDITEAIKKANSAYKARREAEIHFMARYIAAGMIQIPGKPYMMGRHEVTVTEWKWVMETLPEGYQYLSKRFQEPSSPVVLVSYSDCEKFIEKLNACSGGARALKFRMPTKDEWIHACLAGSTGRWGLRKNGQEGPLSEMGWYDDNSEGSVHSVGTKESNAWGLYDMHGNVEEYTSTICGRAHVKFGGSWDSSSYCCEADSSNSMNLAPTDYIGFRLVAETIP